MKRCEIHRNIYVLLLALLAAAIPLSHFLMGLALFLLILNWIAEWNWKEKFKRIKQNKECLIYAAFYLVFAFGLINATDFSAASQEMIAYFTFFIGPILIASSNKLYYNDLRFIFSIFILATLFGCGWNFVYSLTHEYHEYREISRFIDHIRFGLCIVFSIIFSTFFAINETKSEKKITFYAIVVLLLSYLIFSQTLSAITITLIIGFIFLIYSVLRSKNRKFKIASIISIFAIIVVIISYLSIITTDYYLPKDEKPDKTALTYSGREYTFGDNSIIENGYHIDYYVCDEELVTAWKLRSDSAYNQLKSQTLKRYLNSLGLRKDSLNVMKLSDLDIQNVEQNCANVVYAKKFDIRKALYQTFFGFDVYRQYGNIAQSSLLERVELWKTTWQLITEHPILGIGIGNERAALDQRLIDNESQIANKRFNRGSHNQFLSFWLAAGILPLLYFLFVIVYTLFRKTNNTILVILIILTLTFSMFFEDTLNSQTGRMLFAIILPLSLCLETINNDSINNNYDQKPY